MAVHNSILEELWLIEPDGSVDCSDTWAEGRRNEISHEFSEHTLQICMNSGVDIKGRSFEFLGGFLQTNSPNLG